MIQGINENTRLLFVRAVESLNKQLSNYANGQDANRKYIEQRNQLIQTLYNFYNEVELVIQNAKHNGTIFNFDSNADTEEIHRLRAENASLREKLKGMYPQKRHFNSSGEREAFRYHHNSKQRQYFNY